MGWSLMLWVCATAGSSQTWARHRVRHRQPLYKWAPPALVLQKLEQGNLRFASGKSHFSGEGKGEKEDPIPNEAFERPPAIIITCNDSPSPIERMFDQGAGQLFILRTKTVPLGDGALSSLEYALTYLNVSFVTILGHDTCLFGPGEGSTPTLKSGVSDAATRLLSQSTVISDAIKEGRAALYASIYQTDLKQVTFLEPTFVKNKVPLPVGSK